MFKFTAFLVTLTTVVAMVNASPILMDRSPPTLNCAPPSQWSNGSLHMSGRLGNGPDEQLALRSFTNETTGKTEARLTKWIEGKEGLTKLDDVSLEKCNYTTFNDNYNAAFEHNTPLRIKVPAQGIPSGYGYDYPACIGIGGSGIDGSSVPRNPDNGHLVTTGTWPVSLQECYNTDYNQDGYTQAQMFQQVFKYNYIVTANGQASGQYNNPPEVWHLRFDSNDDVIVTSDENKEESEGFGQAFILE
ncbi:unnamed protein product [Sympodiomycopsis kandeliae]